MLDDIEKFEKAKKASQADMSQQEQMDIAFRMHKLTDEKNRNLDNAGNCPYKVFVGTCPVSPTGVPLCDERKGRQQRLEVKTKHIAEGEKKQMKPSLSSMTCPDLNNSPSH